MLLILFRKSLELIMAFNETLILYTHNGKCAVCDLTKEEHTDSQVRACRTQHQKNPKPRIWEVQTPRGIITVSNYIRNPFQKKFDVI